MEEFKAKFISAGFIHEKLFDTPKRVEILKEVIDKNILDNIFAQNLDLLKCNCGLILSRQQEYHLFRKYNYLKYRIFKISKDKKKGFLKRQKEIKEKFLELCKTREILIKCNLRLIVKSASRHFNSGTFNYEEFFSNGYLHMLRAIDRFDYTRNFKFSTYFVNVLFRNLLKDKLTLEKHSLQDLCEERDASTITDSYQEINNEYDKKFINSLLKLLDEDNRKSKKLMKRTEILKKYYGICGEEKISVNEIAKMFGLSRSRIQQINEDSIKRMKTLAVGYDPLV